MQFRFTNLKKKKYLYYLFNKKSIQKKKISKAVKFK